MFIVKKNLFFIFLFFIFFIYIFFLFKKNIEILFNNQNNYFLIIKLNGQNKDIKKIKKITNKYFFNINKFKVEYFGNKNNILIFTSYNFDNIKNHIKNILNISKKKKVSAKIEIINFSKLIYLTYTFFF